MLFEGGSRNINARRRSVVGTKIYSNGPGHMTNMDTTPTYGKYLKSFSPEPIGR